jgi:tRNA-dihydrouridine synthase
MIHHLCDLQANWEYIEQCASVSKVPIIGNGDVYEFEDAIKHFESGNVTSLMLARSVMSPSVLTGALFLTLAPNSPIDVFHQIQRCHHQAMVIPGDQRAP